jgi:hypothetical protein
MQDPNQDPILDPAKAVFDEVAIWVPLRCPVALAQLTEGCSGEDERFIALAYRLAEVFYSGQKPRNNGEPAFTHPTNVGLILKLAAAQPHVIAAGLLHDLLEDMLDCEKEKTGQSGPAVEAACRARFAEDVIRIAERSMFPRHIAERVVEVTWTLTRHKADLYYKSISGVFTHTDPDVRVASALVKLADRMHNIQTIENYRDEEKLYQCFKNLFILNNAKQLVVETRARRVDPRMVATLEKLFKKNGKATFQAMLRMAHSSNIEEALFPLVTYLAIALRKFVLEIQGLWRVQDVALEPGAPVWCLYHGIVKKYDNRLHHEDAEYNRQTESELNYFRTTFASLELPDDQLRRAIYYKDALALMEVVASLLYREDYVIRGFECSRMCRRGRNCMKPDRLVVVGAP